MAKIIIATMYHSDAVMAAATKFGADRLILLIDKRPDKTLQDGLNLITKAIGKVVEIKTVKIDPYDIVSTAEEAVKAIDLLSEQDKIIVNVTSARKTQSLGLLFAAYSRVRHIEAIVYMPEDKPDPIYLPKLSFNLTGSQKKVLEYIQHHKESSISEMAEKIDISRGMLYRNIKELQDLDLLQKDTLKLTDAGRIAVL